MSAHVIPRKLYAAIFVALLVLTFVTVQVAFYDFGRLNIVVALTIAVLKAALVILYFMHIRYSDRLNWVFVGAGFFWLAIMLAFTFGDYLSRPWETISGW